LLRVGVSGSYRRVRLVYASVCFEFDARARIPNRAQFDKRCYLDLVAVQLRQIAVEDDHVVALPSGKAERLLAVESEIDRHPLAPESDRDRRGELSVVFDNQDAHGGRREAPRSADAPRGLKACLTAGYSRITAFDPLLSPAERYPWVESFPRRAKE
jgi:hypothetical protein